MIRALILLAVVVLSGCATSSRTRAFDAISASDASFLAGEVATYVAGVLPPASSTIWLAEPPVDPAAVPLLFEPSVVSALRDRGYAVVEDATASEQAHAVNVAAIALASDGVLVKVSVDGVAASRFYVRDAGGLAAGGAFTVRAAR